jgi:3-methyladenine DNA glycosylase Tag
MRRFEEIYAIAAKRKGGSGKLESLLTKPVAREALASRSDADWLAAFTKCVFQAGFSWQVIETKWPDFLEAFDRFAPEIVSRYAEDDIDRLLSDARIVRNLAKIRATVDNAVFVRSTAAEHGSFGSFIAGWQPAEYLGLLTLLAKGGARLGGATGQRALRAMGYPSYILTSDVVSALVRESVVQAVPTSKRDLEAVQSAFNKWSIESGRSLTEISQVLALSVDSTH